MNTGETPARVTEGRMEVREACAGYVVEAGMWAPKGYKLTEVGVIPEDWKVLPLENVAVIRGGIAKNSNITVSNPVQVHYLRVANVQDGFLDLAEMSQIRINRSDIERYGVLPGDVLMNEGGDLDKLGRGAVWRGEFNPCVHQNHVFVVRPRSIISSDYLNFWTGSSSARQYFLLAGRQTTNLASISKTSLGQLPVALPPTKAEQEAIAEALSDVDALIESLEQLLAKKRQIKQGTMQELLTGKKRLPGFGGEWEVKRLGDLCHMKSGEGITSERIDEFSEFPCYGGNGLRGFTNRYTHDGTYALIGRQGALCGNVLIVTGKFFASEHAIVVTPLCETDVRWLSRVLVRLNLNQYSESSAQPGLSVEKLLVLECVVPLRDEQTAIATFLNDMDADLAALEAKLAKARQIKQGMMQELLTGRIRLV